jgi:hypothetical protein
MQQGLVVLVESRRSPDYHFRLTPRGIWLGKILQGVALSEILPASPWEGVTRSASEQIRWMLHPVTEKQIIGNVNCVACAHLQEGICVQSRNRLRPQPGFYGCELFQREVALFSNNQPESTKEDSLLKEAACKIH